MYFVKCLGREPFFPLISWKRTFNFIQKNYFPPGPANPQAGTARMYLQITFLKIFTYYIICTIIINKHVCIQVYKLGLRSILPQPTYRSADKFIHRWCFVFFILHSIFDITQRLYNIRFCFIILCVFVFFFRKIFTNRIRYYVLCTCGVYMYTHYTYDRHR